MSDNDILSIDEISALMYIRRMSMRKMSKMLGIASSRLHSMFKFKDEEHNSLLRIACTYILRREAQA